MSEGGGGQKGKLESMKTPNNVEMVVDNTEDIGELDEIVEHCGQEYVSINDTLDQLDTCLDTLEERSDGLYTQLKDLLATTRDIRQEFQMNNNGNNSLDQPEH